MAISILLVEDDPDWQKILVRKLKTALNEAKIFDPEIRVVKTFNEADQALNDGHWNLLVTDIGLGFSPLESQQKLGIQLIEVANDQQIPAIAVSGTPIVDNQDVSDLYLEKKVSAFFSKRPFKSDRFLSAIRTTN
jgi:CheY-like chemotaxis protein